MNEYLLELVQMQFETGHRLDECYEDFRKLLKEDGFAANRKSYEFYISLWALGPAGFYEQYKDVLNFDPDFATEYGS